VAVRLDHPVLGLLRARRSRGGTADGCKLGLAVQGGGMRGVLSGAMLTALEDAGYGGVFDAVYGASSGALNAAYFLAGGAWRNLSAYYDDLTTSAFLSPLRLRSGVMDLDFALGEVLHRRKPLDVAAVLGSATRLHVAITRLDPPGTELRYGFADGTELTAALRASAWLPVVSRGTADCDGPAVDGAMLTIHPYRLAVRDGCTHVLSLSSRPPGPVAGPYAPVELMVTAALRRLGPGLAAARRAAVRQYRQDRALLAATDPAGPPYLLDVTPPVGVAPFERDPGRLMVAARRAYEQLYRTLSGHTGAGFATVPRFVPVPDRAAGAFPAPAASGHREAGASGTVAERVLEVDGAETADGEPGGTGRAAR